MRAPQFGHRKGKRRADNAALPEAMPKATGKASFVRYKDGTTVRAIMPVTRVRYADPVGVKVTLYLWHKNAKAYGKGPVVSKAVTGSKEQAKGDVI